MKAARSCRLSGRPGALFAIALAMTIGGCGLKGDLYLEEPEADTSQTPAAETGGGAATGQPTEPGMTAEAPSQTEELVNTEAAMDAEPGSSVIEPGDIEDLEGPGDIAPEQLDDEATLGTDPTSVVEEPVSRIELKDAATESGNGSGTRTEMPAESNDTPGTTDAETDSTVVQPAAKETEDTEETEETAPAQ